MKKGTYFFVTLRRAIAPILRYLLEHCGPLRFVGVKLMSLYLKPVVEWDGHTVAMNTSDFGVAFELESTGQYEATSMRCCKNGLKPGAVFVDVGANIGLFSLTAARAVGKTGHVYAFEPNSGNCALLGKNMTQNGYTNVTIVEKAVSDRPGTCQLFESSFNKGDHRTYAVSNARKHVTIETISLDAYFPAGTHIDMIKMDIEGAEEAALHGMNRVIDDNPLMQMIIECWPAGLKENGTDALTMFSWLEKKGFRFSLIDDAKDKVTPMDTEAAVNACWKNSVANILCVKR